MPNEMTPLEAAEKLEELICMMKDGYRPPFFCGENAALLPYTASCMRKIAADKPVVHARWIPVAKECYDVTDDEQYPTYKYCSHCKISQKWPDHFKHCPHCGALMDGKDDSHAKSDT